MEMNSIKILSTFALSNHYYQFHHDGYCYLIWGNKNNYNTENQFKYHNFFHTLKHEARCHLSIKYCTCVKPSSLVVSYHTLHHYNLHCTVSKSK